MLNNFLNIFFPENCPVCGSRSDMHSVAPFCGNCWQSLAPYKGPKCRKCGKPLVSDVSIICAECISDEPAFILANSFGLYDGTLKKAINLLKYHGVKRLSRPLADLLSRLNLPAVEAVIPVPLHKNRLRQREYNQSALIAYHVAKKCSYEFILNSLIKTNNTSPQVGLSSKSRRKNIKNAFEVRNQGNITGKQILLVDDVITTGATIRECARVIKKAGAESVYAVTLAHGMMN